MMMTSNRSLCTNKALTAALLLAAVICLAACGKKTDYLEQADTYLENGEYALALENYNKAIMEDEQLQEAYRGAGIASLSLMDYETAEDMFLRALKESDGHIGKIEIDLSYYLGETQLGLGKYEDAIECYTNMIDYDSKDTAAYFYRGSAYLQSGDETAAAADFEKVEKDGALEELYGIYEAYAAIGSDEGEKYLEKIVGTKTSDMEELYIIGKAYTQLGQYDKAVEALQESGEKGETKATFYLGYVYQQQEDYDTAISYYQEYKEKVGLSYEEYHVIADYMISMSDYTSALSLNEYMRERAENTELQNLLFDEVVLYEKSGNFSEARNKVEEYLQLYPDDEEALREYEFLQTR